MRDCIRLDANDSSSSTCLNFAGWLIFDCLSELLVSLREVSDWKNLQFPISRALVLPAASRLAKPRRTVGRAEPVLGSQQLLASALQCGCGGFPIRRH